MPPSILLLAVGREPAQSLPLAAGTFQKLWERVIAFMLNVGLQGLPQRWAAPVLSPILGIRPPPRQTALQGATSTMRFPRAKILSMLWAVCNMLISSKLNAEIGTGTANISPKAVSALHPPPSEHLAKIWKRRGGKGSPAEHLLLGLPTRPNF